MSDGRRTRKDGDLKEAVYPFEEGPFEERGGENEK
jgi:hypothetical protein